MCDTGHCFHSMKDDLGAVCSIECEYQHKKEILSDSRMTSVVNKVTIDQNTLSKEEKKRLDFFKRCKDAAVHDANEQNVVMNINLDWLTFYFTAYCRRVVNHTDLKQWKNCFNPHLNTYLWQYVYFPEKIDTNFYSCFFQNSTNFGTNFCFNFI